MVWIILLAIFVVINLVYVWTSPYHECGVCHTLTEKRCLLFWVCTNPLHGENCDACGEGEV